MTNYSKWDAVDYDALLNESDEAESKPRPNAARDAKEGSSKAGIESSLSDLADSLDGAATDSTAPRAQIPASLANAPLRIIFYKAKEMAQKITNPDSTSPCSVSDTDLALALLAKSRELIQSASVFSSNETVSDVNTSDLGYLLAPFYQGQILTKCSNLEVRADKLKEAINYLTEFVEGCLKMEVVSSDQTVAACRRALEGGMPDVSVTRQDRLDRHKREKEIKERLDFLQAKRQGAMSSRGDGDGDDDDEDEEEEGERELITLMLEQSLGKTVTDLPLYKQEIELLAMRKAMGGAGPPRDARGFTGGAAAGRGGGMQTMHIPKGALSGSMIPQAPQLGKGRIVVDGATAADRRAQMQEGVFRQMNPATMTVEEWGEIEMERMQEQQVEQAKRAAQKSQEESLLTEEDKEERDRKKKSDWDDWKDGVKRGSGNKGDHYFQR